MNVSQLIAQLQDEPPQARVVMENGDEVEILDLQDWDEDVVVLLPIVKERQSW